MQRGMHLCLVVSVVHDVTKDALVHSTKDMFDYLTVKELIFYGWQLCIKRSLV